MYYIRNIYTKEELEFKTIAEIARKLGIKTSTVNRRINIAENPEKFIWPEGYQYKKNKEDPWLDILPDLEGFKQIEGYPNYYINKDGDVWNNKNKVFVNGNHSGKDVCLYNESDYKFHSVNTLLAKYFPVNTEGFKEIPVATNYLINKTGDIISKKLNGLMSRSINNNGYYYISLVKDDGERKTFLVHHLVLMTFKPSEYEKITKLPDIDAKTYPNKRRYVTDHIDNNKLNNHVDNLEIVSCSINSMRSVHNSNNSKQRGVKLLNIETKEIIKFPSMVECSRFFGLQDDAVLQRMEKENPSRWIWNDKYLCKFLDDDTEWEEPLGHLGKKAEKKQIKYINLKTGTTHASESISEFGRVTGTNLKTLSNLLEVFKQPITNKLLYIVGDGTNTLSDNYYKENIGTIPYSQYDDLYVGYREDVEKPIIIYNLDKLSDIENGLSEEIVNKRQKTRLRILSGVFDKNDYMFVPYKVYMGTEHYLHYRDTLRLK